MTLFKHEDALVREATAWPVSELIGRPAFSDLLHACQLRRLKLPSLCLAATNPIESPESGLARRTAILRRRTEAESGRTK